MPEEHKEDQHESDTATSGCGLFDLLTKKRQENHYNHAPKEEPSSDEEKDFYAAEQLKKKGFKDKIKEEISGKKECTNMEPSEKANEIGNGEAEKGFMKKIKDKLPGQRKKAKTDQDEFKGKNGIIFDKRKNKLPMGHENEGDR